MPDRLPPQDLDAEQATLGAMLITDEAASMAFGIVEAEDFYREAHRLIFAAMKRVGNRSEPVDLVTVTAELRRAEQLEAVGGNEYLGALMNEVPTAARITLYASIVAEKAVLRRLIGAGADIQAMAFENPEDVGSLLDKAETKIFNLAQRRVTGDFTPIGPLLDATFTRLDDAYRHKGALSGVGTGIRDLDDLTHGLQNGDLIIIAGRPSMGKTSLAINNICVHAATHEQVPVGIFSLEMSKMMLTEAMLCSQANVDSWRLRHGLVNETDWDRIGQTCGWLAEAKIFIDDTPGLPILELRSKARRLKSQADIGLLIIDYLQLIGGDSSAPYETRHQEVAKVARALKGIARELEVPVVALSQLSRRVETREEKRPVLSDLAESGSIEAEADLVSFLYRPNYYRQREQGQEEGAEHATATEKRLNDNEPDEAEIIIAKHRNGPIGDVKVMFDKRYRLFVDIDRHAGTSGMP